MKINNAEVDRPLVALRTILGDARVEDLQEQAATLRFSAEYPADELICIAEFFRLCAETQAWKEAQAHE
jgi:hypothetical protein